MDTQIRSHKALPKIKLSLLSVNFLKQKDSVVLLKYIEELYQSASIQNKEYQNIKAFDQDYKDTIQELNVRNKTLEKKLNQAQKLNDKNKTYITRFKNKIRNLFEAYSKQNIAQLDKLQSIQKYSKEVHGLISTAQNNNSELNKKNHKLVQADHDNKHAIATLQKEVEFLKRTHSEQLTQRDLLKKKTITTLRALESEMKKTQIEIQNEKNIIQTKNAYIKKIQKPLKENQKQLFNLNTEKSELNIQLKIQSKHQNNLIIKLRQYQDGQEKLEQQNQALQKLNQSISLSLNQCRHQIQNMKNTKTTESPSFFLNSYKEDRAVTKLPQEKKSTSNVLAKLYSSYSK